MILSQDRVNHMFAVANKMHKIAAENPKFFNENEMFTLGTLHDIGYKFSDDAQLHNVLGGEILRQQKYKYWKEVYYHGTFQDEFYSRELLLLNYAELTTGPAGEDITFQDKYYLLCEKYGVDSEQAENARMLMESIPDKLIALGLI